MGTITQTFFRIGSKTYLGLHLRRRTFSTQTYRTISQRKSSPTWILQKSMVVKWTNHHRCLSNISDDEEYLKLAERFRNDPMAKGWVQDIQADFENEYKSKSTNLSASETEKVDSGKTIGEPGTANEGIVFQSDSDTSSDSGSESDSDSSSSDSDVEGDSGASKSGSGASGVKPGSRQGTTASLSAPEITETTDYIIKQVLKLITE